MHDHHDSTMAHLKLLPDSDKSLISSCPRLSDPYVQSMHACLSSWIIITPSWNILSQIDVLHLLQSFALTRACPPSILIGLD